MKIEIINKVYYFVISTSNLAHCSEIVEYFVKKQNNNTWFVSIIYTDKDGIRKTISDTIK